MHVYAMPHVCRLSHIKNLAVHYSLPKAALPMIKGITTFIRICNTTDFLRAEIRLTVCGSQHSRESNPAHFSRNRYRFKVLQEQYRPSFHFNVVSLRMLYLYYLGSCHTFNPCLIVHIILIQAYWHCWSLLHAMALLARLVLYSVRGVFVIVFVDFFGGGIIATLANVPLLAETTSHRSRPSMLAAPLVVLPVGPRSKLVNILSYFPPEAVCFFLSYISG